MKNLKLNLVIDLPDEKEIKEEADRRFIEWDKRDWTESGATYAGFIEGAGFIIDKIINDNE